MIFTKSEADVLIVLLLLARRLSSMARLKAYNYAGRPPVGTFLEQDLI